MIIIKIKLDIKKILDDDLFMIHKGKVTSTINKPTYLGLCILDLSSKVLMPIPKSKNTTVLSVSLL